jgi:hypothetical protein
MPVYKVFLLFAILCFVPQFSCMRYLTHERSEVLLDWINIDETLKIAEYDLEKGGRGTSLTLWAIRDQNITPVQAVAISAMYFKHVESIKGKFDTWHLTWAISNMYRNGDKDIKTRLKKAFEDASSRATNAGRMANKFANTGKIYMGDAHSGGRAYAYKHVVVPGNYRYMQSYKDYLNYRKRADEPLGW